jgi:hypothetical protein
MDAVAPWLRAGFPPQRIRECIDRWELTDVLPLIEAGCPAALTVTFLERRFEVEVYLSYLDAGIDWREATTQAEGR